MSRLDKQGQSFSTNDFNRKEILVNAKDFVTKGLITFPLPLSGRATVRLKTKTGAFLLHQGQLHI